VLSFPSNPNNSEQVIGFIHYATKSLLLCDISKIDNPESLKFKIAFADFSKLLAVKYKVLRCSCVFSWCSLIIPKFANFGIGL
jgi:hypothetical protein